MSSFNKNNINHNVNHNINHNVNHNVNHNNTIIINNKRIRYYKYHHDLILPTETILDMYNKTYQNYILSSNR